MHHDNRHAMLVVLRAPSSAHHLEHVGDWKVNVPPAETQSQQLENNSPTFRALYVGGWPNSVITPSGQHTENKEYNIQAASHTCNTDVGQLLWCDHALAGCIKKLGALDDDKVSRRIDPPRQGGCCDQHLHLAAHEKILRDLAVVITQASVVQADAKLKGVSEGCVLDRADDSIQLLLHTVHKLLGALVRSGVGNQIQGGQTGLPVCIDHRCSTNGDQTGSV